MKKLFFLAMLVPALGALAQNGKLSGALEQSYDAEKQQDYKAAIAPLDQLGADAAANYIVQLRLGWLHYCAKEFNESIAAYGKAAQISPQSVEALLGLMLPQQAAGKNDDALRTAQTILREDPNNYTAISHMAWILFARRDYMTSVTAYRKLVTLYPTDTEMLLGLGYALKYSGHAAEAAKYFQTVLLLSPDNSRALAGLKTDADAAPAGGPPGRMMQEPAQQPGHRPTHQN